MAVSLSSTGLTRQLEQRAPAKRSRLKSGHDGQARQGRQTTALADAGKGRVVMPVRLATQAIGLIRGGNSQERPAPNCSPVKVAHSTIGRLNLDG